MKNSSLKSSNSPHLALVLSQLTQSGEIDEEAASKILVSFETSVTEMGALEIGFTRDPAQNFNPRAARILLILIKDAKVRSPEILIQACELASQGENYQGYVNADEPIVISAVFLLDRLRHLHLEKNQNPEEIYLACLKAKELLSSDFAELKILLMKGVERMKRNFS